MFGSKLESLVANVIVEDAVADKKTAKRIGQYKFSNKAIYKADGTYLPLASVTGYTCDKSSVHVTGCCAGGVPVERIIFDTTDGRHQFLFDTKKDLEKAISVVGTSK